MLTEPDTTLHARRRAAQRRIPEEALSLLFTYGDIELPQRNGCRSLQLSRETVAMLNALGWPLEAVECASRVVLILSAEDRLVTAIKDSTSARRTHRLRGRTRR